MKIKVTDHIFKGNYYPAEEVGKLKYPVFFEKQGRYLYVWCFKKDDTYWQDAYMTGNEVKSVDEAWKLFMNSFDLKHNRYFNDNENRWKEYDAVMPRSKVPEGFTDIISVITK